MKSKVFVIGTFGYFNNQLDGQTVKTRNIFNLIKSKHNGDVTCIDTLLVKKKPWLLFSLLWKLVRCNKLVILPCTNNLTILFPVVFYLSKLFRYEIIHICIGGWQVEYFLGSDIKKPRLPQISGSQRAEIIDERPIWTPHPHNMELNKKIKVIMPEMQTEVEELRKIGFSNIEFFPNFRIVNPAWKNIKKEVHSELRLVFMARIMRMKGYDVIFEFANYAKKNSMEVVIDFYGQINKDDEDEFISLLKCHPENTNYCGYLAPDKITSTLMNYDMMMLPTHYFTESLPGTILDSYIAGIPIIATKWKYATEFIEDGRTGFIVPFENGQDVFNQKLTSIYYDREMLQSLKQNAQKEALKYSEEIAWHRLEKYL